MRSTTAGDEYAWEKLLLATGGRPRTIPGTDGVVYYRTLDDYRAVRARCPRAERDRRDRGRLHRLGDRGLARGERLPGDDGVPRARNRVARSARRALRVRDGGTTANAASRCWRNETVEAATAGSVTTGSGRTLEADRRHRGARHRARHRPRRGSRPRRRQRHRRRRVRPRRRVATTSLPPATWQLPGRRARSHRFRVEHEDHAKSHGRAVGANMAGANAPYDHLPFFYSDMFDLGYEAVGEVDSRLETVQAGRSRTARGSSPTSTTPGGPAGSSSGTSGTTSSTVGS